MKKKNLLVVLTLGLLVFQSCSKKDNYENVNNENNENHSNNEKNISFHNASKSHNMGQNCMNCHKNGGPGEGWFNVAGTVYNETVASTYPNATVRLYTGKNGTGTLKYTIEVDAKGNFFTTDNIDFSTPLYPSVQGLTATQHMQSSITTGQCNNCHSTNTNRIWTK